MKYFKFKNIPGPWQWHICTSTPYAPSLAPSLSVVVLAIIALVVVDVMAVGSYGVEVVVVVHFSDMFVNVEVVDPF